MRLLAWKCGEQSNGQIKSGKAQAEDVGGPYGERTMRAADYMPMIRASLGNRERCTRDSRASSFDILGGHVGAAYGSFRLYCTR